MPGDYAQDFLQESLKSCIDLLQGTEQRLKKIGVVSHVNKIPPPFTCALAPPRVTFGSLGGQGIKEGQGGF